MSDVPPVRVMRVSIDSLPIEMINYICRFLPCASVLQLMLTTTRIRAAVEEGPRRFGSTCLTPNFLNTVFACATPEKAVEANKAYVATLEEPIRLSRCVVSVRD
jgi:hypothetical protein